MTPANWLSIAIGIMTLVGGFAAAIRFLVKHYLSELKPNSGSSLKDKVTSLEDKVELLTELVKEALKK